MSEVGKRLTEAAQGALATARDRLILKRASASRPSGERPAESDLWWIGICGDPAYFRVGASTAEFGQCVRRPQKRDARLPRSLTSRLLRGVQDCGSGLHEAESARPK